MSNTLRVAQNALISLSRYGVLIFVGLVTSVILGRKLGTDGVGIYAIVLSIARLSVAIVNTGIQNSIIYHIAQNHLDIEQNARTITGLALIAALAGTLIAAISLLFSNILYPGISLDLLITGIVMIPIIILTQDFTAILTGLEDFKSSNMIQVAPQVGILVFTIFFVWVIPLDVAGGVLSVVLGNLMGLIFAIFIIRDKIGHQALLPGFDMQLMRQIAVYGSKTQIGYMATILNYRADLFLLNWFTGATFVGIYSQAVQIGEKMWVLSQAVAGAVLPRISALKGFDKEREQVTSLASRYMLAINIMIAIGLYFFGEFLIVFLYGEEFRASATVLKFLLPGLVTIGTARVIASDISGRGKPEINSIHSILSTTINILLNILLIPMYGFIGSAIATSISYSLIYVLKLLAFRHITGSKISNLVIFKWADVRRIYRFVNQMMQKSLNRQSS